jgi:cell division transport system ATP-binding protein
MINFNNVNKTYPGGFLALKQVNFTLAAGEMAFLTGHSGAGKSTLLKLISMMEKPSSGSILVNNI